MNFIEYNFTVFPAVPWTEILIAKLSVIEFDSFEENESGVKSYILQDYDDEEFVKEVIEGLSEPVITYEKNVMEQVNWNSEWEKNFEPIEVDNRCFIRAEFHDRKPEIPFDIIIQPKMSFGTGHHATTYLMVDFILDNDFEGKDVLDMGTGTGILAILAKMKGAARVDGIDIDEWSYENAVENAERNKTEITFFKGGAETIPDYKYDVIVANINKNILIEDLPFYTAALKEKGTLFLSGLYNFDEQDIVAAARDNGLNFVEKRERNEWIALKFKNE